MENRRGRTGRLLAGLQAPDLDRVLAMAERKPLSAGDVLWARGARIKHVYFPIDCVLSNILEMADGFASEVASIGNEGVAGYGVCMGVQHTPFRTVVTRSGTAHCIPAAELLYEFHRGGAVQGLLLRYSQAQLTQVAYGAACNKHHAVGEQLARMLLSAADRMRSSTLMMTHEKIASVLGVRRESVSEMLIVLARKGLIKGERGKVTLVDRQGLEHISCECYAAIRDEFDSIRRSPRGDHERRAQQ